MGNEISRNQTVLDYAKNIIDKNPQLQNLQGETHNKIMIVLNAIFDDEKIRGAFRGAEIRYSAMCGEVARQVLAILGLDPNVIGLMSIGDVDLPPFARDVADQFIEASYGYHKELLEEEGYGYDLASKGSLRARQALVEYFDRHYDFASVPGLKEKLAKNSTIVGGGMRGLDDIATAMINTAAQADPPKKHRFIQPDNSFGTWHSIVALRSNNGATASVHNIPTQQKNLLHITPEQVEAFYREYPPQDTDQDSWCITPVGNPSGTAAKSQQLAETCGKIVECNPNAVIILDCTYVRTLPLDKAKELMAGIIQCPAVLNRVIFVESFSKTHGFCGERIGAYFSANDDLYDKVQNINMMLSAGNGRQKSALVLALTNASPEQEAKIHELHEFWAKERKGLYYYLIKSGNFSDLFEPEQDHIQEEQLNEPLGLYLFLKLKPGVDQKQVLVRTGCLGVLTSMGSGTYIRFAVGKIKESTYTKYLTN